jgi:hypothetical protein
MTASAVPARPSAIRHDPTPAAPPMPISVDPLSVQPVEPISAEPVQPPSAEEALAVGVLMVVSIPAQHIFVFKHGSFWGSSPVSTGRRGYGTPAGVFPILQKKVHHRSNLYDNAPMPYMQRLTWSGVALHAGRVPGYPASHGCIRLPRAFARRLYAITNHRSVVVVTREALGSAEEARRLGGGEQIRLAGQTPAPTRPKPGGESNHQEQTIQLSASSSSSNAVALWHELIQRQPELASLRHDIIPATVHGRRVFRLRASGADAHLLCARLASAGVACLNVRM